MPQGEGASPLGKALPLRRFVPRCLDGQAEAISRSEQKTAKKPSVNKKMAADCSAAISICAV
jgi:hypothetical protein